MKPTTCGLRTELFFLKPRLGLVLGHWQTVYTQIRLHRTRLLMRVCTVCLNYPFFVFQTYIQRQSTHQYCQCFDFQSYYRHIRTKLGRYFNYPTCVQNHERSRVCAAHWYPAVNRCTNCVYINSPVHRAHASAYCFELT